MCAHTHIHENVCTHAQDAKDRTDNEIIKAQADRARSQVTYNAHMLCTKPCNAQCTHMLCTKPCNAQCAHMLCTKPCNAQCARMLCTKQCNAQCAHMLCTKQCITGTRSIRRTDQMRKIQRRSREFQAAVGQARNRITGAA